MKPLPVLVIDFCSCELRWLRRLHWNRSNWNQILGTASAFQSWGCGGSILELLVTAFMPHGEETRNGQNVQGLLESWFRGSILKASWTPSLRNIQLHKTMNFGTYMSSSWGSGHLQSDPDGLIKIFYESQKYLSEATPVASTFSHKTLPVCRQTPPPQIKANTSQGWQPFLAEGSVQPTQSGSWCWGERDKLG